MKVAGKIVLKNRVCKGCSGRSMREDVPKKLSAEGTAQEILCGFPSSLGVIFKVFLMHNTCFVSRRWR